MAEQWKPIPGFEGLYEASDQGQIKRIAGGRGAKPGRILKQKNHPGGYKTVTLSKESKYHQWLVHRLVCAAFLGPAPQGITVNHKNDDRADNRLENLEYATYAEQEYHAKYMLRTKGKLTPEQVVEIRERYAEGDVTQKELANKYGVTQNQVGLIVTGRSWSDALGPVVDIHDSRRRLSKDEVEEIRKELTDGLSISKTARKHDVTETTIRRIKRYAVHPNG